MARNTNEIVIWYDQTIVEDYTSQKSEKEGESWITSVGNSILSSFQSIIGYENDDLKTGELGNIWFENVRAQQRSRVTRVPLENGTVVWDSKVKDPVVITMRIAIKRYSNTLVNGWMHGMSGMPETWQDTYLKLKYMYDAYIYSTDSSKVKTYESTHGGGSGSAKETKFAQATQLTSGDKWESVIASPYCMVQTGAQVYRNMALTGLTSVEDNAHFDYLQFDLEFTQQIIVGDENEILPKSAKDKTTATVGNIVGMIVTQGVGVATSMSSFV